MKSGRWGWAGYDVDDPDGADYCHQTDVHANGMVHSYSATNGNFGVGHGHDKYKDMNALLRDEKLSSRSPNDPESLNHPWKDPY